MLREMGLERNTDLLTNLPTSNTSPKASTHPLLPPLASPLLGRHKELLLPFVSAEGLGCLKMVSLSLLLLLFFFIFIFYFYTMDPA